MAKEEGACEICDEKAAQKCANCHTVYYCSREHQKRDWKSHKNRCIPARVKQDAKLGRYLEASRDIKMGDVVFQEKPLVVGPAQLTPPVCLGCYKLLEADKCVPCDKCGWPVCSQDCAAKPDHVPECVYTAQRGEKMSIKDFCMPHPNYQCIIILRCLHQRDHDPPTWARLQALESHCLQRQESEKGRAELVAVTELLWKTLRLEKQFTKEEIMKCCGIVLVNAHEVPLAEPAYVAIYDRMSLPEHNCRPNCNKSFTSDGQLKLIAGVPIKSGEHLSVCYTDPMWGTEVRRQHLAQTKFFECFCQRCVDPTELGTMFDAVKCQKKECNGYLLPETFIQPILMKADSEEKSAKEKTWQCRTCKSEVKEDVIQKLLEDIGKELNIMPKGDPDACERFIDHCGKYLHASHFYLTDVSLALAQIIGQDQERALAGVSDDRLLLKTQLCKRILNLLETLMPAELRLRGTLQFELHAAVAETGRRASLTEGPPALYQYVQESRQILSEAVVLLRHEPEELPEGKLHKQALKNLQQMDALLLKLSSCLPSPI